MYIFFSERPLSDPVIVHVASYEQALSLVDIDASMESLFKIITDHFWPGPLTVILKAKSHISPKITANTGYVGLRWPANKTAQTLIRLSERYLLIINL